MSDMERQVMCPLVRWKNIYRNGLEAKYLHDQDTQRIADTGVLRKGLPDSEKTSASNTSLHIP